MCERDCVWRQWVDVRCRFCWVCLCDVFIDGLGNGSEELTILAEWETSSSRCYMLHLENITAVLTRAGWTAFNSRNLIVSSNSTAILPGYLQANNGTGRYGTHMETEEICSKKTSSIDNEDTKLKFNEQGGPTQEAALRATINGLVRLLSMLIPGKLNLQSSCGWQLHVCTRPGTLERRMALIMIRKVWSEGQKRTNLFQSLAKRAGFGSRLDKARRICIKTAEMLPSRMSRKCSKSSTRKRTYSSEANLFCKQCVMWHRQKKIIKSSR
jgi:hypothetical protein